MKIRALVATLLIGVLAGCNTMRNTNGTSSEALPTTLRVDNQGFLDMTVYVMRSVERSRLGIATGHSSTIFRVPSSMLFGVTPLRFVADPIGGNRASVSEEITVVPGDSVVLTIPPS